MCPSHRLCTLSLSIIRVKLWSLSLCTLIEFRLHHVLEGFPISINNSNSMLTLFMLLGTFSLCHSQSTVCWVMRKFLKAMAVTLAASPISQCSRKLSPFAQCLKILLSSDVHIFSVHWRKRWRTPMLQKIRKCSGKSENRKRFLNC